MKEPPSFYDRLWGKVAEELDLKLGQEATDSEVTEIVSEVLYKIGDGTNDSSNGN